jgi:UDPglucose--hexose-1-phosphate uridylyltransferase
MPELRQNVITRDWVIIATERARRPDQFARKKVNQSPLPTYESDCPFCLGNERLTKPETFRLSGPQGWTVRVVPNKFAALSLEGERVRKIRGIYRSMSAVGMHEVIIEHPRHDLMMTTMSVEEVARVLSVYLERYKEAKKDPRFEAIIVFKNYGEAAGTSLQHPHSQLAATPVVPSQIRMRIDEAIRYFDDTGECVFCRTLMDELEAGERVVFESTHFVAFVPYAALSPFHTWIFPRRHSSSFGEITIEEVNDLALNLKTTLTKLHHGLNDPDFNYTIRSIPTRDEHTEYFHWYLSIVPRISRTAGFELGSGMFINTALPEESAKYLRELHIHG